MGPMMDAVAVVFAGAGAAGLVGFCAWCVWLFTTKEYTGRGDWTTALLYRTGQGVIWLCALLVAGGVLGGAASAVWRALTP